MDKEIAEKMIKKMLELSSEFSEIANTIKKNCDEKEFITYRNGIGKILADIFDYLMLPIFRNYPDLIPEELKHLKDKI